MIDPLLVISLFAIRTKKALVKSTHTANVYAASGYPDMGSQIRSYITNMRDHDCPRYMTFTSYRRNHKKADILHCSAIMLEYPFTLKTELETALSRLPFAHYQIDTQADFHNKAEARILVAFPLVDPITDPSRYTRVASLLWEEIGIEAHTRGDISATFLFCPFTAKPKVELRDAGKVFLDADAFWETNRGNWVVAKEGNQPKPKATQISADGLWEGL